MKLTLKLIVVLIGCGAGWAHAQHFPIPGPLAVGDCPLEERQDCKALEASKFAPHIGGPKPREFPGLEPRTRKRTVVEHPAYEPLFADRCEDVYEKFVRTEKRRVDGTWHV